MEKYRDSEKAFKSYKGHLRHKNNLYWEYIGCQKQFDKELRSRERTYNRGKIIEIDKIQTNNPRAFWKMIKSLGPRKTEEFI